MCFGIFVMAGGEGVQAKFQQRKPGDTAKRLSSWQQGLHEMPVCTFQQMPVQSCCTVAMAQGQYV